MDFDKSERKSSQKSIKGEFMELKLQCPFTWDMDNIDKSAEKEYSPHDDEDFFPLLKLMRNIMTLFVKTKENEDSIKILDSLNQCDEILLILKQRADPQISAEIAEYILQATKYFVFQKLKMDDKCDKILTHLRIIDKMSKIEKSTLEACRSICWSKYHRLGADKAIKYIRLAIDDNPSCDLWWFILGKNLRRKRRNSTISTTPSKEEVDSFLKAYNMSKNPVYGIFVAQLYREMRKYQDAHRMYDAVFDLNPQSKTILLRLALGYIQNRSFNRARNCLDRVSTSLAQHSMYLHYEGLYYFKQNQYGKALPYLKGAARDLNLPAERQLLKCMLKTDRSFNLIQYLLKMLDRYEDIPEDQIQSLLLDVAMTYWKREHNMEEALKYFLKAIDINPKAKCLTDYFFDKEVILVNDKNVYRIIERDFLPALRRGSYSNAYIKEEMNRLKEHCSNHHRNQYDFTENAFSRFKLKD